MSTPSTHSNDLGSQGGFGTTAPLFATVKGEMEERIANREQLFEDILKSMQLRVPVVVDDDDDDDKNKVWVEVPPEDEKWNQLLKYDEKGETAETFDTVTIDELRKAFQLKKYHTPSLLELSTRTCHAFCCKKENAFEFEFAPQK